MARLVRTYCHTGGHGVSQDAVFVQAPAPLVVVASSRPHIKTILLRAPFLHIMCDWARLYRWTECPRRGALSRACFYYSPFFRAIISSSKPMFSLSSFHYLCISRRSVSRGFLAYLIHRETQPLLPRLELPRRLVLVVLVHNLQTCDEGRE